MTEFTDPIFSLQSAVSVMNPENQSLKINDIESNNKLKIGF